MNASTRRWPRPAALLPALALAAVQGFLLVGAARDMSDTVDEDTYLTAAGLLWAHHDFSFNPDSPVLPKWAFGLGMRAVEPDIGRTPPRTKDAQSYLLWYGDRARLERVLLAARSLSVAVTVAAGLLMWWVASRWGTASGLVAQALWCFSPTVLASGALATLDAWVTAMVVAVIWAAARLMSRPSWPRWTVLGVVGGLALACKITAGLAVALAVLAGAWAHWRAAKGGRTTALGAGLAACAAGAALMLWALYLFSWGRVSTNGLDGWLGALADGLPPLPFPPWIQGVLIQVAHGMHGHRGYLFGETSTTGWWWFYLAALALKTTIGAQALAVLLAVAWWRRRPSGDALRLDVLLLAHSVLLVAVMSMGRTQLGIRYILPAFPTAILWAARTFPALGALAPRWGTVAGLAALTAGTVGALRVHPHSLMFFNSWVGGPTNGPRYIVTGDCIGQDQRRLGEWLARQGLPWIYYTWYSGRPEEWGVSYVAPPCSPRVGVYALEAIEVHRPRRIEPGCLDWLTVEEPDERVGYSIYVYRVPRERLRRLLAAPPGTPPFWKRGRVRYSPAASAPAAGGLL